MAGSSKPIEPVKPVSMEIIFIYVCPTCGNQMPLVAPTMPAEARCDRCRQYFPVVPIDRHTHRFLKLMLNNGHAAIDPDFL